MTIGFVAVVRARSTVYRPALLAAGASVVLSWAELATSTEPDDVPVVLVDQVDLVEDPALADRVSAVLHTLISVDPFDGSPGSARSPGSPSTERGLVSATGFVIATVRPVIDTLKFVDAAGVLCGTAERDEHRFVGTPIAARLHVLRPVFGELGGTDPDRINPTPVAVLAALVARGATVIASSPSTANDGKT